MDYIYLNNEIIVELYFKAWLEYDIQLINKIFYDTASYVILPRKRVLAGTEEIVSYWIRNSKRQKDLTLNWKIENITNSSAFATFMAKFYDDELGKNIRIQGIISFLFENNRIVCLSEHYEKVIE